MEVAPERVAAWFGLAKRCFADDGWALACERPPATFSHRSCPWGGHLIRFDFRRAFIQDAPEQPQDVLCRPEVRGTYPDSWPELSVRLRQTLAPGDAVVERQSTSWLFRLASVLFGDFSGPQPNCFFYDPKPIRTRHQLRRDFPEPGDCAYAVFEECDGTGQEGILICRRDSGPKHFHLVVIFRLPQDKWPFWAQPLFPLITDGAHKGLLRYLNRPALREMHVVDANFYTVLAMRSFNRGPPLLPCGKEEAEIAISSGEAVGLKHWRRFCSEKFQLAEYLRRFAALMAWDLEVYDSLEGRGLVSYQCAVPTAQWHELRPGLLKAMNLQKAAYRRGNGGTTGPTLVEARPHLVEKVEEGRREVMVIKTVVRNTFLELDEGPPPLTPPLRRTRSLVGLV